MSTKIATKPDHSDNGHLHVQRQSQLHHQSKMVRNELNHLDGLGNQETVKRISDLVSIYGPVRLVKKVGEENCKHIILRIYMVSFYHQKDAQRAMIALNGLAFGEASIVLMLN